MTARGAARRAGRPAAGQTIVLFALASLTLMAALGLVLDGGYNFAMRRAMQNAADAAALAGARAIARDLTDTAVLQAVRDAAARNGVADAAAVTCALITNSYPAGATPPCSATGAAMSSFAANYTGVLVRVAERHRTFALVAVGVPESGTAATAAAQVQAPVGVTVGPFMPCGIETALASGPPGYSGGIYQQDGTYADSGPPKYLRADGHDNCEGRRCGKTQESASGPVFNPAAFAYQDGALTPFTDAQGDPIAGPAFLIHDPQGITPCNNNSQSFKGINTVATTLTMQHGTWSGPDWTLPPITTGNVSSVNATVEGVNGCQVGAAADRCIMVLPVVDNSGPGGTGANALLAVRTLNAFYIEQTATGTHTGKLIQHYTIKANSDPSYTVGSGAVSVIRLVR